MEDRDFFDHLMQMFTKTSFAENRYWDYESLAERDHNIRAVNQDGDATVLGGFDSEADADFITAVHGCFPDLHRRLHSALDEADRADRERDEREQAIAEQALEIAALRKEIRGEK
jgi:hypothetical protein